MIDNSEILKNLIDQSGYRIQHIAKQLGLTYQGFSNKVTDIARFRANEIAILCDLLKIDDETRNKIFFDQFVD